MRYIQKELFPDFDPEELEKCEGNDEDNSSVIASISIGGQELEKYLKMREELIHNKKKQESFKHKTKRDENNDKVATNKEPEINWKEKYEELLLKYEYERREEPVDNDYIDDDDYDVIHIGKGSKKFGTWLADAIDDIGGIVLFREDNDIIVGIPWNILTYHVESEVDENGRLERLIFIPYIDTGNSEDAYDDEYDINVEYRNYLSTGNKLRKNPYTNISVLIG
jgi:hypothetical protein